MTHPSTAVERELIVKLLKHLNVAEEMEGGYNDLLREARGGCVDPQVTFQRRDVIAEAEAYLKAHPSPGAKSP